jgi:DNA-binding transcriptional MerR regulator
MYSISEVAQQTGFTAHTLRYYEKIGLLSSPARQGGKRLYTAGEIRLLQFMKVLKHTGMSLEDIQEFLVDGCLLEKSSESEQERNMKVRKRKNILEKHLLTLEQQKRELEMVIQLTEEKLTAYRDLLEEGSDEKR